MEYLLYCLPAALIAGAAFFSSFRAERHAERLKKEFVRLAVENEKLREALEEVKEVLDGAAFENRAEEARREAAFFQGLQNIFNYGGGFSVPKGEGIKHE